MMLAHVIGAESRAVVERDQPQAVFILLVQRIGPVVVLIEDAELHRVERVRHDVPPATCLLAAHDAAHEECPQVPMPRKPACACRLRVFQRPFQHAIDRRMSRYDNRSKSRGWTAAWQAVRMTARTAVTNATRW